MSSLGELRGNVVLGNFLSWFKPQISR
jgi:hypothetical protein